MKYYGNIKFSTVDAPKPLSGICETFSYKSGDQVYEIMGESDLEGIVLHGRKGELSFSSTPPGDVAALGVRAGAELVVSGISGGKIVVLSSTARWQRGQPMTMEAQATHYPSLSTAASGAITPATMAFAGDGGPLVLPTDKVWFGVHGIAAPVPGIVQSLSITESVTAQEEADGSGDIVAVALYGYKASGSLEILTSGAVPAVGSALEPFDDVVFRVTNAEERWNKGQMRSVALEGILVPGVTEEDD